MLAAEGTTLDVDEEDGTATRTTVSGPPPTNGHRQRRGVSGRRMASSDFCPHDGTCG
jgi:hypothetical protein